MSYVSIWKPVNNRIVQASRETKNEIIGLLLGKLDDDTIIIEDSITGEFSAEPHRVTLPASTLAKIADDLVTGRIKGNIVGWYHSHVEGGLFFSNTDIETQKKLQQFSSLITAMVVDAVTGDVGYFRIDIAIGKPIRVPDDKVRIFREASEAIPPEIRARPAVRPSPTIEVRAQPSRPRQAPSTLIISIVLIALVASLALLGVLFLRSAPAGPALKISHNPIVTSTLGTPIEVGANITGPVRNVTLQYAVQGTPMTRVEMNSQEPSQYYYMIPGEQVTGNIAYLITAVDTSGNPVQTDTYHITVSDFLFQTSSVALTVYRTKSTGTQVTLLSINGFNGQVALSASGTPQGLTVSFTPNLVSSGTAVQINVAANSAAPNGTFSIPVTATYIPAGASPVTRQVTVIITVADFDLQVSPSSGQASRGATASYTLTLTVQRGFVDPVTVNVANLPQGTTYQLVMNGSAVLGGSPGTFPITLQITTTPATKSGTYTLTINAAGGGIVHTQNIQLTVR